MPIPSKTGHDTSSKQSDGMAGRSGHPNPLRLSVAHVTFLTASAVRIIVHWYQTVTEL